IDLLSVLTHEAGHFLGLAHSADADATMFSEYKMGSTGLRDLSPDDVKAICAAYPPDRQTRGECSYLPRHGYSPDCKDVQLADPARLTECEASPAGAPAGALDLTPAAAALILLAARRSRRRLRA